MFGGSQSPFYHFLSLLQRFFFASYLLAAAACFIMCATMVKLLPLRDVTRANPIFPNYYYLVGWLARSFGNENNEPNIHTIYTVYYMHAFAKNNILYYIVVQ